MSSVGGKLFGGGVQGGMCYTWSAICVVMSWLSPAMIVSFIISFCFIILLYLCNPASNAALLNKPSIDWLIDWLIDDHTVPSPQRHTVTVLVYHYVTQMSRCASQLKITAQKLTQPCALQQHSDLRGHVSKNCKFTPLDIRVVSVCIKNCANCPE